MSVKRPSAGLHVRITDELKPGGVLVEARVVREGIVADGRDQPANPSMIALLPVSGNGKVDTCEIEPTDRKARTITIEVVGWPVGMIALWSAYDRGRLRDVFVDEPFRWDGEVWAALDYRKDLLVHDGKEYPADNEATQAPVLTMGATIWDGVVR